MAMSRSSNRLFHRIWQDSLTPQNHGDTLGNENADNLIVIGHIHNLQPVARFERLRSGVVMVIVLYFNPIHSD